MQAAQATLRQSVELINAPEYKTMQAAQATLRQRMSAQRSSGSRDDASRTGYAEAKWRALPRTWRRRVDASRTGYAEAKYTYKHDLSRIQDASRTGYCARQKQTSAARQEIFECVEKQNQWH